MNPYDINDELRTRLEEIKSVPPRDLRKTMQGRAKFLNEALTIEGTVSRRGFLRLTRWKTFGKEKLVMNAVLSMIVIAGLLFGGGATVSAAQDDLPGQPLYALKTASEDVSVQIVKDPQAKVLRLMDLVQIRLQEMTTLVESGQIPPDRVATRLEQHLQAALQICANMDDATLDPTLLQVRDRIRLQDRDMEKLQLHANPGAQPLLERTRAMMQQRLQLVDEGLLNHEQFRHAVRNGFRFGQTTTPSAPGGGQNQNQYGQPTTAPGGPNTDPGGPNADATPGPNNDNGSGPGSGSGGNGFGGNDSGGSGTGGNGTGGNGTGGNRP